MSKWRLIVSCVACGLYQLGCVSTPEESKPVGESFFKTDTGQGMLYVEHTEDDQVKVWIENEKGVTTLDIAILPDSLFFAKAVNNFSQLDHCDGQSLLRLDFESSRLVNYNVVQSIGGESVYAFDHNNDFIIDNVFVQKNGSLCRWSLNGDFDEYSGDVESLRNSPDIILGLVKSED